MAQTQLQPRPRPKRKRTWRKRRPSDPRHYSVTIGGEGHWQPSKRLRAIGFRNVKCGPDGPEARSIAEGWNRAANAEKAAIDAAQASMDVARFCRKGEAIYPYVMLRFWSMGNAPQLQRLRKFRWGRAGVGVTTHNKYELMSTREFEGEFESSLKPQNNQTQQSRISGNRSLAQWLKLDLAIAILTFLIVIVVFAGFTTLVLANRQ